MPAASSSSLPRITIITPSYNQAEFLQQCIASVVSQDYPNLEYFIMDGGSQDSSVEIIQKYAARYPGVIRWQSKKDGGQAAAINTALSRATGDIVAYLNSDDWYLPGSLHTVARYFQNHPDKLWAVGGCRVSSARLKWTFFLKSLWPVHLHRAALFTFNTINQPAVFLTRSLVGIVGHFNQSYHYAFDYEYWLRCVQVQLPGKINSDLAVFRIHSDSKGNLGFNKQLAEDWDIIQQFNPGKLVLMLHYTFRSTTVLFYRLLKK